jgi:hypothetical protein
MVRSPTSSRATTQRLAWAAPITIAISAALLALLCADHPRCSLLLPCDAAAAAFAGIIVVAPTSPSSLASSLASSPSYPAFATTAVGISTAVDRNRPRRRWRTLPFSRPSSSSATSVSLAATASSAESGGHGGGGGGGGGGGTTTTASRLERTAAFMEWAKENGIK